MDHGLSDSQRDVGATPERLSRACLRTSSGRGGEKIWRPSTKVVILATQCPGFRLENRMGSKGC